MSDENLYVYSCSFSEIWTLRYVAVELIRELTQLGRSEPLVFELGSHYQMMGTNPAQNFGVVLLNLYPVCLHQAALSWCFLARELKTLIHVSLSIYISYVCVGKYCLYSHFSIIALKLECYSCFRIQY